MWIDDEAEGTTEADTGDTQEVDTSESDICFLYTSPSPRD